ncbi:unnamed protein product [Clonostachys byssicola]|uniref:Uncharacterized protein n=1 Tax=Clonostachys byssicola TaxID=160290 RepID=A0A9N9UDR0_9HYPO|nr:unnamed protein product [Clonostachys byssicola]
MDQRSSHRLLHTSHPLVVYNSSPCTHRYSSSPAFSPNPEAGSRSESHPAERLPKKREESERVPPTLSRSHHSQCDLVAGVPQEDASQANSQAETAVFEGTYHGGYFARADTRVTRPLLCTKPGHMCSEWKVLGYLEVAFVK